MTSIANLGRAPTMTSLQLVDFINSQRAASEAVLRQRDFTTKAPKVLREEVCEKFRAPYVNPQNGQIYRFPKREARLMAMSYSYELQAKVFGHMTALEEAMRHRHRCPRSPRPTPKPCVSPPMSTRAACSPSPSATRRSAPRRTSAASAKPPPWTETQLRNASNATEHIRSGKPLMSRWSQMSHA
ncbi:hypothetical protein CCO03_03985 [Comamonas serinivorans]|uniref:Uncharacterized protein n=1 Tax=Comamonas serinivorans TaxID=1082851 RepID=A0A1Y0EK37_9BURK|nr:hypothetical protein [Comamonas serinivorans]ARU03947.1 hypothetical protein CCO03_03985 [Comamonas serinivorans]